MKVLLPDRTQEIFLWQVSTLPLNLKVNLLEENKEIATQLLTTNYTTQETTFELTGQNLEHLAAFVSNENPFTLLLVIVSTSFVYPQFQGKHQVRLSEKLLKDKTDRNSILWTVFLNFNLMGPVNLRSSYLPRVLQHIPDQSFSEPETLWCM